ncbi:SEL1-like repeat protein [Aliiglaciecola sp. 3_MG-2023]|uniref:tetratricopeptide repeat protein n=1 Tax=Aliiglaciecola sp. 3_MG-2023 TaxID=3062644 RepID=UPI0026E2B5DD|nr:SEL1-like repeat protein [Aliiglaciecola sp. 3_MG-2023]MDO6693285.1 SEL1-like repeat protein [Aliiglaciecola sp. 3_MG-2023]
MSSTIMAADIFKADKHYTNAEYQLAKQGYIEATKVGNPHAFYQLGNMYQKGLGVKKDPLNALIYISMAADFGSEAGKITLANMLAKLNDEQRQTIEKVLNNNSTAKRKALILQTYFPIIQQEKVANKITFEGEIRLDSQYFADAYEEIFEENVAGQFTDEFGEDESDDFYTLISKPKTPYLIVDHDIAIDGSKRNITEVQRVGTSQALLSEYTLFPTLKPSFQSQPVEFVHRVYMGAAVYNKFTLIEQDKALYASIYRNYKKLKKATSLNDQYLFAMTLQNFPWLEQQQGEVSSRLLSLAKQGHPGAMFEYGYMLLREQKDLQEAIKWIGIASSYGLARAEYRLGKLLTTSPWVEYDEKKALFWFESAVEKNHVPAALKAAELKLTANDESLHDVEGAIDLLTKIAANQHTNPEYFYLLALSHKDRENRDYTQVISNLEKAIFMASNRNWDVSEWQDLLVKLTQGKVYIVDDD